MFLRADTMQGAKCGGIITTILNTAVEDEPMATNIATTNQISGLSGSNQQSAGNINNMESILFIVLYKSTSTQNV